MIATILKALAAALVAYAEHKKLDRARMLRDALDVLHTLQHEAVTSSTDPEFPGAALVLLNARLESQRGFILALDPAALPPLRPRIVPE